MRYSRFFDTIDGREKSLKLRSITNSQRVTRTSKYHILNRTIIIVEARERSRENCRSPKSEKGRDEWMSLGGGFKRETHMLDKG